MDEKLPHISDKHHFAIAHVAVRASLMEVQIEQTIEKSLPHQPNTAAYMLKNLGMDRVVGLLKAVLLDAAPEEAPKIEDLIKTINDLRTERNEILHWNWIPGQQPDTAIAASGRPFREFRYAEHTAESIQKTAHDMKAVVRALLEWQSFLQTQRRQPSPKKP